METAIARLDAWTGENRSRAALAVGALALLVQLLYLSQYAASPFFWEPRLDALFHDKFARDLLAGKASSEPYFRAPLYGWFLAGIYGALGQSPWAVRLAQAVIESGSVVLALFLGLKLFRPATALLGAASMALYGPLVYNALEYHTPVLEVVLDLAMLLALLSARAVPTVFLSGLLCGLSALARPNALVLVPVALVYLAVSKRKSGWALAFLASALVFPLAVTARNYRVGGDPVFIASQGGINLFLGNRPGADGFTPSTPTRYRVTGEYEDSVALYGQRAAEEALGRPLKPSEVSRYWTKKSVKFWRESPSVALALTGKKLVLALSFREIRNNTAFDYVRAEWAPLLWLAPLGFWLAGPLGILGMCLAKNYPLAPDNGEIELRPLPIIGAGGNRAALVAFSALYLLSFVVFFAADRYRLPLVPILLLFGAHGVVSLSERAKQPKVLAPALAGLTALGVLCNVEWVKTSTAKNWAQDEWSAGNRLLARGRAEESEARTRKALALDRDSPEIWSGLGTVLFAQSKPGDAVKAFAMAARLAPENPADCYNAALCLKELGRRDEAKALLTEALRRDPTYSKAQTALASYRARKASMTRARTPMQAQPRSRLHATLRAKTMGRPYIASPADSEARSSQHERHTATPS